MFSKQELIKGAKIVGMVALSAYVLSRFLPGLAVRVGLQPRPAFSAQIGWAEPFGLIPVVGPGFSNVLAYGYPPIWSSTPVAATPGGAQALPAASGSSTDQTVSMTT